MNVAFRAFAVALVIGLGWWLARLAPPSFQPAARTAPATFTPAVASSAAAAPPSLPAPEVSDERLLREVAMLSAEFDRLRALPDDIDTFRRSAELENDFMAMLDADTAAFLIRRQPPGFVDSHFGILCLIRWASGNRSAAAAWMAAHPGATPSSAEALARGWFSENRPGLEAHLDQLPPGPWRNNLAVTAAEDAFLAKDPAATETLLARAAPDDARRLQLAEWNATAQAIRDPEAAAVRAAREPDSVRREKLLAAVAIGQANHDPAAAADRLFRTVSTAENLAPSVRAIARLWAARDPAAAARWCDTLPPGPLRDGAEEGLLAIAAPQEISK